MVPCGTRPDKPKDSKPELRLEMTRLALKDFFPKDVPIKLDPIEVEHGESIPTVYLLDGYIKKYPNFDFWFVMGTDLIEGMRDWDEGDRLIADFNFLIFQRHGYDQNKLLEHPNWPKNYRLAYDEAKLHKNLLGGIMTNEVKMRLSNGLGISGLVTPSVVEFIRQ